MIPGRVAFWFGGRAWFIGGRWCIALWLPRKGLCPLQLPFAVLVHTLVEVLELVIILAVYYTILLQLVAGLGYPPTAEVLGAEVGAWKTAAFSGLRRAQPSESVSKKIGGIYVSTCCRTGLVQFSYSSSVTWLTKRGHFILLFPHFGVPSNHLEV